MQRLLSFFLILYTDVLIELINMTKIMKKHGCLFVMPPWAFPLLTSTIKKRIFAQNLDNINRISISRPNSV